VFSGISRTNSLEDYHQESPGEVFIVIKWLIIVCFLLASCANETRDSPADSYVEKVPTTVLDAPSVNGANAAPINRAAVERGEYLLEMLGCGVCHTNGALVGSPDENAPLSGSDIGIAFTTPLLNENPAIVYAPNLTPEPATGIGGWTEEQIVAAFRQGEGQHGNSLVPVMPWPGYSMLSDEDAYAIASYLLHIDPVVHRVPDNVPRGKEASGHYVYFGVYEKK